MPERTQRPLVAVIPAYNEATTIRSVAMQAAEYVDRVIVVDDGSDDHTANVLRFLPVTMVRNEANRGKGRSLLRGFSEAARLDCSAVVTLDADGQHAPECIPDLVAASGPGSDRFVQGVRRERWGHAPLGRYLANIVADVFISWIVGRQVRDSQSGFRLYPGRFVADVTSDREAVGYAAGFAFESEILIAMLQRGYSYRTVLIPPVYPAGGRPSYYQSWRDTVLITRMVVNQLVRQGFLPRRTG